MSNELGMLSITRYISKPSKTTTTIMSKGHFAIRPDEAHPVVPGSPICGMRMPSAAGARGHSVAASDRRLDSPAGPKGRRNCHRHADKQLKAPGKLETHPPFQISFATPIC
jgi:hypothetical protein